MARFYKTPAPDEVTHTERVLRGVLRYVARGADALSSVSVDAAQSLGTVAEVAEGALRALGDRHLRAVDIGAHLDAVRPVVPQVTAAEVEATVRRLVPAARARVAYETAAVPSCSCCGCNRAEVLAGAVTSGASGEWVSGRCAGCGQMVGIKRPPEADIGTTPQNDNAPRCFRCGSSDLDRQGAERWCDTCGARQPDGAA